jgi:glucose/arabinose dehydrogenase
MNTQGSGAARATRGAVAPSLRSFTPHVSLRRVIICGVLLSLSALACPRAGAATLPAGFTETQIGGLSDPTAMAFAPDGRLFVCQQGGALRVVKDGALLATPFLTVTVNASGERGLLGVAFDPNFNTNRFIYVYYTATTPAVHNRVSRFTASASNPDVVEAGSEFVLLDLENLSATNHNGGALHFGADGKLYVAVGENAVPSNAQTLANKLGKILRLNPDGTIPPDNPFFSAASGTNRAIWVMGLRNPYTFDVRRTTGGILINDVGQNVWEEINVGVGGSNYGWPTCEGLCPSPAPTPVVRPPNTFTDPVFQYNHDGATCAVTGGAFYDPASQQFPDAYVGKYFYADFCAGWIRLFDPTTHTSSDFATGVSLPVDLKVSSDGSLWYLARGAGSVFRVRFTAANTPPAATITSPAAGALYGAGDTVNYSGAGADAEDGALPPSALAWRVDFHHDTHAHPFIPATSGATGGSFVIPNTGETSANVWYRIYLTVVDSRGATTETFRDIFPRTATVKLSTSPAGLQVTLDSQPRADGYAETNVVGMRRTLGVPSPQTLGGARYNFAGWSDNGAATHDITVPAGGARYKAVFSREARAGEVVISEFRIDGPNGSRDEFVELSNNTDQPITVSTSDGSAGWALVVGEGMPQIGPPTLNTYHVIPAGTVIPARGHYLVTGAQYSLADYGGANAAAGDAVSANDIGRDYEPGIFYSGIALFRTALRENFTTATRLDAVGAGCYTHPLLVEGTGVGPCDNVGSPAEPAANYSLARRFVGGALQDTDDNAADFRLVAVRSPLPAPRTPSGSYEAALGAPGPENSSSPRRAAFDNSPIFKGESCKGASAVPSSACERVRETTPVAGGSLGTLSIRRRFTNRTGLSVTRLRFRVVSLSTLGGGTLGDADLRALTSPDITVTLGKGTTATVRGTSVEEPPAQTLGGGINSTLSAGAISLASPLAPGASVNVQFRFGVEREGVFRFAFVIEALP